MLSRILLVLLPFLLAGCATTPHVPPPDVRRIPGIYHEVKRGQTLWRISKTYNVSINEIVAMNRLPDAAKISAGQRLFIPGAKKALMAALPESPAAAKKDFIWPVKGKVISFFGSRKGNIVNKGIDIQADEGTEVLASRPGVVTFCDEKLKGYGKTVIVDHNDGFSTVYAHNSEILTRVKQRVTQDTVIARVGSTGRASRPYLHFEIRKGHKAQNPFHYLP